MPLRFDQIGYWSEIKLSIIKEYAAAYSKILSAQAKPKLHHVYIDGFAGAGEHLSKQTQSFVPGSPLNALHVAPPFREYHLIDLDGDRVEHLRTLVGNRNDVSLYNGDCNEILLRQVFPHAQYKDFRRGLCVLDPYGLHLSWEVMRAAGQMKTLDMFLNFPVMDMNMNVLWQKGPNAAPEQVQRMNFFWGDESWRQIAYKPEMTLFGPEDKKAPNEVVAEGFRQRLRTVAGFANVPEPLPMTNESGAIVYYLFFASAKAVAQHIVTDIFNKYRSRLR